MSNDFSESSYFPRIQIRTELIVKRRFEFIPNNRTKILTVAYNNNSYNSHSSSKIDKYTYIIQLTNTFQKTHTWTASLYTSIINRTTFVLIGSAPAK